MMDNPKLSDEETGQLTEVLKTRFMNNMHRHAELEWHKIELQLSQKPEKLWSLSQMEKTGGEPDVVAYDYKLQKYIFVDCSAESPAGRRSLCYDRAALDSRKENKPINSAMDMAESMGTEILDERKYRELQLLEKFDTKTSSWLMTPSGIRSLGGAIFGDFRYGTVFIYHNGADSYYAARGFRSWLAV